MSRYVSIAFVIAVVLTAALFVAGAPWGPS
jgi:hypothetical protein